MLIYNSGSDERITTPPAEATGVLVYSSTVVP